MQITEYLNTWDLTLFGSQYGRVNNHLWLLCELERISFVTSIRTKFPGSKYKALFSMKGAEE